jgi:UDPglucose--hexose-1-phosphate uridylyltransferase
MTSGSTLTHSEIRHDAIHDRIVIVAPGRGRRPNDSLDHLYSKSPQKSQCVFCPKKLTDVKALDVVGPRENWKLLTIANIFPAVSLDNPKAYGTQEVIVETPEHDVELAELPVNQITELLKVYARRTVAITKNPKIKYVLIFKNNGGRAGASIAHAHSQIFATDFLPPHILHKLSKAQEYRIQFGECYYDHLLQKERNGPRWVTEDAHFAALTPYASAYNYEAWLFPKRHVDNITLLNEEELGSMAAMLKKLLQKLAELKLPYNYYLHEAVKDYEEHFYLRIAPRRDVWAGVELGSRLVINTIPPEQAAAFYRGETSS